MKKFDELYQECVNTFGDESVTNIEYYDDLDKETFYINMSGHNSIMIDYDTITMTVSIMIEHNNTYLDYRTLRHFQYKGFEDALKYAKKLYLENGGQEKC